MHQQALLRWSSQVAMLVVVSTFRITVSVVRPRCIHLPVAENAFPTARSRGMSERKSRVLVTSAPTPSASIALRRIETTIWSSFRIATWRTTMLLFSNCKLGWARSHLSTWRTSRATLQLQTWRRSPQLFFASRLFQQHRPQKSQQIALFRPARQRFIWISTGTPPLQIKYLRLPLLHSRWRRRCQLTPRRGQTQIELIMNQSCSPTRLRSSCRRSKHMLPRINSRKPCSSSRSSRTSGKVAATSNSASWCR